MAWIGYRPYVPADPAKGLRPGTSLPVAPTRLPARRGLRVPESYLRRERRLRLVVAADVATVLAIAGVVATTGHDVAVNKALFVGAFAGAAAVGLALACLSLDRSALRIRASSGWIVGVPFAAAGTTLASTAPALAAAFGLAGLAQVLGGLVVREATLAADAEASRSHTAAALRGDGAAGDPDAATAAVRSAAGAVAGLRAAVLCGGVAWILGGLVEATHGNWWLGILATGLGVLAVRRAPDLGFTRTDARVRASDRANPWAWAIVPLGAVGVLVRAAWLVGWI
jgi:hypothetical protein